MKSALGKLWPLLSEAGEQQEGAVVDFASVDGAVVEFEELEGSFQFGVSEEAESLHFDRSGVE